MHKVLPMMVTMLMACDATAPLVWSETTEPTVPSAMEDARSDDAEPTPPEALQPMTKRGQTRAHNQLCSDLKLISSVNSDEASDAYRRGDKKAGDEHARNADRSYEDAKQAGCGWAA